MPIEVLECLACRGDLEIATKEPFHCPYCGKLLRLVDEIKDEEDTGNKVLEIVDEETVIEVVDSVAFVETEYEEQKEYDPEPITFTFISASYLVLITAIAFFALFGNSSFSSWGSAISYLYFAIIAFYTMTKFNNVTNTISVEASLTTAFAVLTCLGVNLYLAFTNYHQFNNLLLNICFGLFVQLVTMVLSLIAGIILQLPFSFSQKPLSAPR